MSDWYLYDSYNLRRINAANHPSMIPKGAVTSTGGDYIEGLRSENARLLAEHKVLFDSKDLHALALENEVLAAIIDGHLFKERITEVVKTVLFEELDDFLGKRFSQGATYAHTQVTEAKHRLEYLRDNPD